MDNKQLVTAILAHILAIVCSAWFAINMICEDDWFSIVCAALSVIAVCGLVWATAYLILYVFVWILDKALTSTDTFKNL